jgi:uncharacterized membrane protein YgaE (UPF0421/DUF939 family)
MRISPTAAHKTAVALTAAAFISLAVACLFAALFRFPLQTIALGVVVCTVYSYFRSQELR